MPHPSAQRLVPDCRVIVEGSALPAETDAALTRVEVDLDANLFGECVLTFHDPRLALINGKDFGSGTAVRIEAGYHPRLSQIFEGEVVALEPQFRRDLPPSLRVVCQQSIHRLALGPRTRAFNAVDDSEIVQQIAQEHGLSAEAPQGTKEHVLQSNLTDAQFLRGIAAKGGHTLRIEGKKLVVGGPPKGAELQLGPGDGVRRAKVTIKAHTQVGEVSVHGWDPKTKQEFVATARPEGEMQQGAKDHGGSARLSLSGHGRPPADMATAEAMAKGRLRRIAERFATAEMDIPGNPDVVPGAQITVEKLGAHIDGTWRVEHAAHCFDKQGYRVSFRAVRVKGPKPPKPEKTEKAAPERQPPPKDVHLIVVEVKSIGGTPLPNHPVRLVDATTGQRASDILHTDAQGMLRAEAPGPGKYRVQILDRSVDDLEGPEAGGNDLAAALVCQFLGVGGGPLGGEEVEVKIGDDTVTLTTDADGRIDAPATFAAYEVKIRGETFLAHGVPAQEKEHGVHVFVVGEEKHDQHVLAVLVKGIGDTPLVRHPVRVLDPDSGEAISEWLETDDEGYLRTTVPDERTYRIEIGDEDLDSEGPEAGGSAPPAHLAFRLVSPAGAPLADEPVRAKCGDDTFDLKTDDEGRVDAPAELLAYDLEVRGEKFTAHAVLADDAGAGESVFVVGEERHDRHVLSVTVTGAGGTPLVRHRVRVLDPDTGEPVSDWLETDDEGLLRTEVPDDRTWRIEIEDLEAGEMEGPEIDPGRETGMLVCVFTGPDGAPLAHEPVEAGEARLQTDANGRLEAAASLGPYELKVRGKTFHAHGLPADDAEKEENVYRFVVEEG